ncbi:MAG: RluA family pseudouridine synthase [Rubrivivax sp.]|nr:RluA family pseudouridine synthase [Rubrivivax sp.]
MSAFIVHVDAALIVVDKPAGLLAVPGRGADKQDCVVARLQAQWPDALTVHRLDMATSGLMVFARGAAMQRALSQAFAERRVAKRYTARVAGRPAADSGSIALPLAADWPQRPKQKVDTEHGKPSLTHWRLLATDGDGARLELEPITGRTHQLRVHLAASGHAIVGDALYAPAPVLALSPRLCLHASRLEFSHPGSGQALRFDSPAPF